MKLRIKKCIMDYMFIIRVVCILLLLFALSNKLIKKTSNNQTALTEATHEDINYEPNSPKLSAGMIPVKKDGENWVITTKEDTNWYDYENGKPAYIMLNNGTYQSELIPDMTGKKLAKENNGVQIQESELGSIYMWLPRFAINSKTNDIKYICDIQDVEDEWTIPDIFTYKQTDSTKPDFLLTGVWVSKEIDTSYTSTINEMNEEESRYGLIANTKATKIATEDVNILQQYVDVINLVYNQSNDTEETNNCELTNITNINRIILKIINQNNVVPIKANALYDKDTGLITVQVTYSQYGVKEITHENVNKLTLEKYNGIITANTVGIDLEDGENIIEIVDNNGNKKEFTLTVSSNLYATVYKDTSTAYTLTFSKSKDPLNKSYEAFYEISEVEGQAWSKYNSKITEVIFVDNVAPISTAQWFYWCSNLTTITNIEKLNTSKVSSMRYMFAICSKLTSLDLSSFDTSNLTDVYGMFWNCKLESLNLSGWSNDKLEDMSEMFYAFSSLKELNLTNFNTSNVKNMSNMFNTCSALTELDLSSFDTSNVTNMVNMFGGCNNLTSLNLSSFDTSNVTNMSNMFAGCNNLTSLNLSSFDTSNVKDMNNMFNTCSALTELDLSNFNTSNVTNIERMFSYCDNLSSLNLSGFDLRNFETIPNLFVGSPKIKELNLSNWNVSTITNMTGLFNGLSNLTSLDMSNWNTSNVTNMTTMFYGCSSLTSLDLSDFDTSNVTTMHAMFYGCSSLISLDLSNFNTSNVTSMHSIFNNCSSLISLDLSNFDTSNVTIMYGMFQGCNSLTSIDLSSFDTSNVTNMNYMFEKCSSLTKLDLTSFNTIKVTDMHYMFQRCSSMTEIKVKSGLWRNASNRTSWMNGCGVSSLTYV